MKVIPTLVVAPVLASGLAARDVLVVDQAGGADHVFIHEAIAAADSGDTILVRTGEYLPFVIDGAGLTVVAEPDAEVRILGSSLIANLQPHQRVLLTGLHFESNWFLNALNITACEGPIWIEDGSWKGSDELSAWNNGETGRIIDSASVTFNRMVFEAGANGDTREAPGNGLYMEDSTVYMFDSVIKAGDGGSTLVSEANGQGGAGVLQSGGFLYMSNCSVQGGDGGPGADELGCTPGGDGGSALVLYGDEPSVQLIGTKLTGGAPGPAGGGCAAGEAGMPHEIYAGEVNDTPGRARSMRAQESVVLVGEDLTLEVYGLPGDLALVAFSVDQMPTYLLELGGPFLLTPSPMVLFSGGTIGDDGLLITSNQVASLGGVDSVLLFSQLVVVPPAAEAVQVGSGQALVFLEPILSGD